MKKMLIAAVVFTVGLMAQASTVAWSINNVVSKGGTALDAGSVYVFFVAGSTKADTSSWADLNGKGSDALSAALAGATTTYTVTDAAGSFAHAAVTPTDIGVAYATKYSVYAVILDTTTVTDDTNFFVTAATAATTTFTEASAMTKTYSLTASASSTSSNWYTAAPEPTSGLLMLLGMAGLALRRKRA